MSTYTCIISGEASTADPGGDKSYAVGIELHDNENAKTLIIRIDNDLVHQVEGQRIDGTYPIKLGNYGALLTVDAFRGYFVTLNGKKYKLK